MTQRERLARVIADALGLNYDQLSIGEKAEFDEAAQAAMTELGRKPIADMPEELRDGRRVLVWVDGAPIVAWWGEMVRLSQSKRYCWFEAYSSERVRDDPTHYSEIITEEG